MPPKPTRVLIYKLAVAVLVACIAAAFFYLELRASRLVSSAAGEYLGLETDVKHVDIGLVSGLTVYGITVKNPPGYSKPHIAYINSLSIRPDYRALMRGELTVSSVRVYGPELVLIKDGRGAWNAVRALDIYKELKKKRKPSARVFSLDNLEVTGGMVRLPDTMISARINSLELTGFSTREGSRTSFTLEADDTKDIFIEAAGGIVIFGKSPTADAVVTARAENIGGYLKGGAAEYLKKAGADARLELKLAGAKIGARLGAKLRGLELGPGGGQKPLVPELAADISYDKSSDSLDIASASLKLPNIVKVGANGNIKGAIKSPVGRINLIASNIDLKMLNGYLPKGVSISGMVVPEKLSIDGPLRPFTAVASGGGRLEAVRLAYGKYDSGPVNGVMGFNARPAGRGVAAEGLATLDMLSGKITAGGSYRDGAVRFGLDGKGIDTGKVKGLPVQAEAIVGFTAKGTYEGGRLSAEYGLNALGGRLDGIMESAKGVAGLVARVRGLELARIKGVKEHITGSLDADVDATFLKAKVGSSADYRIAVKGFSLPDRRASLARLELKGTAGLSKDGVTAAGRASAEGFDGYGRHGGRLYTGYSFAGSRLSLKGMDYEEVDLSARVADAAAVIKKDGLAFNATGVGAVFRDGLVRADGAAITASMARRPDGSVGQAGLRLEMGKTEAYGLAITGMECRAEFDGKVARAKIGLQASGNPLSIEASAEKGTEGLKNHVLSGNLYVGDLRSIGPVFEKLGLAVLPAAGSLSASFEAKGEGGKWGDGSGRIKLSGLSVAARGRTLVSGLSAELAPVYANGRIALEPTRLDFGGSFGMTVTGSATREGEVWTAAADVVLPKTKFATVQEGVIESLPERLMWADYSGDVSADLHASYSRSAGTQLAGAVELDGAKIELSDAGLTIGPAYGRIPLGVSFGGGKAAGPPPVFRGETFDRDAYDALVRSYSKVPDDADLVIDRIRYGFVDLDAVALDLVPGDGWYDINWFGMSAFGGGFYGYGRANLRGGGHALSLIVSDFSLTELCNTAPPIKGYLSGRVDGLMRLMVSGKGYRGVTGAAMFWAKDGPDEDREISKEFIKKLMGSSMKKYMSFLIGDRYFDTGELDIVFSDGNLLFEKLLIENTNLLGQRDLHITVAPVSNKITIEHLLDVIKDVGARAKGM